MQQIAGPAPRTLPIFARVVESVPYATEGKTGRSLWPETEAMHSFAKQMLARLIDDTASATPRLAPLP
jgi:hypothetical protein